LEDCAKGVPFQRNPTDRQRIEGGWWLQVEVEVNNCLLKKDFDNLSYTPFSTFQLLPFSTQSRLREVGGQLGAGDCPVGHHNSQSCQSKGFLSKGILRIGMASLSEGILRIGTITP
jgi:hypothetical protein